MAIFSRPKNTPEHFAIFDFNSASLGVGLVEKNPNTGKTNLAWSARLPLQHHYLNDFSAFERDNHLVLRRLADELKFRHSTPLSDIHCFLASPWLVTEIDQINIDHDQDILLTNKILSNLTNQNLNKHLERYGQSSASPFKVIDDVVLQTKVNGYEVSSLDNKKAKNLQINHFTSFSEQNILAKLKSFLMGRFHHTEPKFHSNILSNFAVTKKVLPKTDDLIILDVTGELTDITITHAGTISHIGSFPFGKHSVARNLANKLNTTPSQAYSLLKLYSEGDLYPSDQSKLEYHLQGIKKEWQYLLGELLASHTLAREIKSLVVIVDDPISVLFGKWAEEVDNHTFSSIAGDVELYTDLCHKYTPPTKDTGLLIDYLFVENFL